MTVEKTVTTPDIVKEAQELIKKYMEYMDPIHERMIKNEEWYKLRHWNEMRNQKYSGDPEPTTAFLLSTIENKHADAMDFYPKAHFKPRHADDVEEAKRLSELVPVELEWNDFYDTWSKAWDNKLRIGCGIYAELFDPEGNNGIGASITKSIDPINFYCDPFVADLKMSKGVFITELMDNDEFLSKYPEASQTRASKLFEPKHYIAETTRDTADMTLIIDYYYLKKNESGQTVVHYLKFAGDEKLYWSEESEDYQNGYYEMDQYPFELDVLYEEKDNIFGFGMIDVVKSPQIYIDKLDQIILTNTLAHSRKRFFFKESAGISEEDMLDPSKVFIKVNNLGEEHIREWEVRPTDQGVYSHRKEKIAELKEISSTTEFSRGETGGGVTAAQAIAMLQKASGKTSRVMIAKSYQVFSKVMYLKIENFRQFYDVPRQFRVDDTAEPEGFRFSEFDNKNLQYQPMDALKNEEVKYRKPVFDIRVEPERQDPFSQAAQNELAKELYQLGIFTPEFAVQAEIALNLMNFEGRDQVIEKVKQNNQMVQVIQTLQKQNFEMKMVIQGLTGKNMGVQMPNKGVQGN